MIALGAILTTLTTVTTAIIQIPIPQTKGYINFGDMLVIFSGLLLGPYLGFFAGGVGSALADILTGYGNWAPFTLVIKGLEGFIVGVFAKKGRKIALLGAICGGLEMVIGYFMIEYFLYGTGAALAELPGNIMQATVGIIFGTSVYQIIHRGLKRT